MRYLLLAGLLAGCAHKEHIRDPDREEEIAAEQRRHGGSSDEDSRPTPRATARRSDVDDSRPPPRQQPRVVHPTAQPASSGAVKIVSKEPSASQYELIGKLSGEALSDDTVDAPPEAEADLKRKAAQMGASLVKIDKVIPLGDSGRRFRHVVFVARAFRAVTD